MIRVLLVLHQPLFPLFRGDNKRIFLLCEEIFKLGYQVDLVELLESFDDISSEGKFGVFGKTTSIKHPSFSNDKIRVQHEKLVCEEIKSGGGNGLVSQNNLPSNFRQSVNHILHKEKYDAVLVANSECLPAVLPLPQKIKLLFCPCDVQFHALYRMEEIGISTGRDISLMEREEANLYKHCDLIAAVSENDSELIRKYYKGPIVVAPVAFRKPEESNIICDTSEKTLFFVGSASKINIHAVNWFLEEVWGKIYSKHPDARLLIAGKVSKVISEVKPGVELCGTISDIGVLYSKAQVVISPIKIRTGIYVKNIEAMIFGKALVATPESNYGLKCPAGEVFLEADDSNSFAESVISLLNSPEYVNDLGHRAMEYAYSKYTPEVAYRNFIDLVKEILASDNKRLDVIDSPVELFYQHVENINSDFSISRVELLLAELRKQGWEKLILYGAGKHTTKLLAKVNWGGLKPALIIDDNNYGYKLMGVPVMKTEKLFNENYEFDAIMISSDLYESQLKENLEIRFPDNDKKIITIYS